MAINKRGFVAGAAVGVGVAVAAAAGAGVSWPGAQAEGRPPLIRASTAPIFAPPPGAPMSFADIFEKVSPAVVSIDVTSKATRAQLSQIPGLEGFPFAIPQQPRGRAAPGGRGGRSGPGGAPSTDDLPETEASGSGFLISADGYVVTNNHVIENATKITVTLQDKRELLARVIGRDESTDLAVIKIDGANFPFVDFENQGRPRVGDWVLAVGNPFTLGGTATAGIVSAYGRDIGDQFVDYIQIDAPINRGNSGGPTFDVYGRVIGINTAIFSPSGGSVGIGFAIPADIADRTVKQLIAGKTIQRGYLGVSIQTITPEVAESLGIKARSGVLVGDVTPGGPGAAAGLQTGDIIVSLNGKAVASNSELSRLTAGSNPGDPLRLEVLRNGRRLSVTARSGVRPSPAQLNANDNGASDDQDDSSAPAAKPGPLGLSVAPLTPELRKRYGIDKAPNGGVVVVGVEPGSDASRKLKAGDVITRAGDRAVNSPADVAAATAEAQKAGRPAVFLFINRDGRTAGLPVKIQK